jgi:hypothetical protein
MKDSIPGMRTAGLQTLLTTLCLLMAHTAVAEPEAILLWPHGAPGSEGQSTPEIVRVNEKGEHTVSNVHFPSITPYLPARDSTRTAVIVVPGGGHRENWRLYPALATIAACRIHLVRLSARARSPHLLGSSIHPSRRKCH